MFRSAPESVLQWVASVLVLQARHLASLSVVPRADSLPTRWGAGDPGANPDEPWRKDGPRHSAPETGPNQFEFHLSAEDARRSGLPAVDYVVNNRGNVDLKVGSSIHRWSGEQARSPYAVFGSGAEKSVRDWTRARSDNLMNAIPGSEVLWPAEATQ